MSECVQLGVVDCEVSLQLLHIELEVVTLRELTELLNEEHGIVLLGSHQKIVISESHKEIQLFRWERVVVR